MLLEPKRINGKIDLTWWNTLTMQEKLLHNVSVEILHKNKSKITTDKTQVVIVPQEIDTSSLETSLQSRPSIFRPQTWDEYKGQDKIKNELKARITGCQKFKVTFHHLLLDGKAGMGKTSLAVLLAKYLNVKFVECVTNTLSSPQQLIDKIAECNGGVLFLDEIHEINKKLANFILPLMEDFRINGINIKPFTLFTATTEKGILLKKFKPFVDRFKIQHTLEDYTLNELVTILKQYKERLYGKEKVNDEIFVQVARNCRATPRIGIRLLESYLFMNQDLKTVLETYDIIKNGITKEDIKVLQYLNQFPKGVGVQTISGYLGTSEQNYVYIIEGYLLQQGLITKMRTGRIITDKGKEFLNEIR